MLGFINVHILQVQGVSWAVATVAPSSSLTPTPGTAEAAPSVLEEVSLELSLLVVGDNVVGQAAGNFEMNMTKDSLAILNKTFCSKHINKYLSKACRVSVLLLLQKNIYENVTVFQDTVSFRRFGKQNLPQAKYQPVYQIRANKIRIVSLSCEHLPSKIFHLQLIYQRPFSHFWLATGYDCLNGIYNSQINWRLSYFIICAPNLNNKCRHTIIHITHNHIEHIFDLHTDTLCIHTDISIHTCSLNTTRQAEVA